MTDKDKSKPVTLADYIPPAPALKSKRSTASKRDSEKLDALAREVRDEESTEPKRKGRKLGKKKSNVWTIVFYCVALIVLLKFLD